MLLVWVVGVESLHSGSSRRSALWILLGQVYRGRWSFLSKCPAKVPHAPSDCLPPDAMEFLLQHRGADLRLVRGLGSMAAPTAAYEPELLEAVLAWLRTVPKAF